LTNFGSCPVNFIEEENNGSLTSSLIPLRRVPRSDVAIGRRKSKQVTLSHLRGTTLNDGKTDIGSELIDNLRFTDTVATTNQDWLENRSDMGNNRDESFEIDSHFYSLGNNPVLHI
jgi:hypothetical protein